MDIPKQFSGQQGRDHAKTRGAEGANLGQAKPDETLRQKDPAPDQALENLSQETSAWDTDGVKF